MSTPEFSRTHTRQKRVELLTNVPLPSEWACPVAADLPEDRRKMYLNSRLAVNMWVEGAPAKSIEMSTSMKLDAVRRLVQRCISTNPATRAVVGFYACLPGYRQSMRRERIREFNAELSQEGKGLTGSLQHLFKAYPGIEIRLLKFVDKRAEGGDAPVPIVDIAAVYEKFITLCKDYGLRDRHEWPFNVSRKGYMAVHRWFERQRHVRSASNVNNVQGEEAGKLAKLDFLTSSNPKPKQAHLGYERVELDEHKEDADWKIAVPVNENDFAFVGTDRLYALLMRCCGSEAVLSSCVSYKRRYAPAEISLLVYMALRPPARKNLIFQNQHFQYDPGACYPGELPEFKENLWQSLALDADASHFSDAVLSALEHDIGCHVLGERIGQATARYGLEGFFKYVATICKGLPSATGNKPDSSYRRNPETGANSWNMVAPIAEHMLDVKCRNYNVTAKASCGGISPLQKLQEMLAQGKFYRSPLGELRKTNLFRFLPRYRANLTRKRGAKSLGPFGVYLYGGRYVGREMAQDAELSYAGNIAVTVYVQEDARFAFVVPDAFPERCYPVALTGAYSDIPHTLAWRQVTYNYRKNRHIEGKVSTAALMMGMLKALGDVAKTDRPTATLLSGVTAFIDRFGRGDASYVGMEKDEREKLTEFAHKVAEQAEAEGLDEEPPAAASSEQPGRIWVPETVRLVLPATNVLLPNAGPPAAGQSDDPFGIL
jgi:hypothetical protein